MNVLLTAVGRRAYLVEYFKQVVHPLGGKVYATNTVREATGFLAADAAEIVPPSAAPTYVDELVELCKKWNVKLLFSLLDWDAAIIAQSRDRFVAIGTIPVMGTPQLFSLCLDKYKTLQAAQKLNIPVPKTVFSVADANVLVDEFDFPIIVKPRFGHGSLGLFKVTSQRELELAYEFSSLEAEHFASACTEIDGNVPQVMIQQCLPGPEYGCDIVNDLSGRYRRAFVKHKFAMRSGETDIAESVDHPQIGALAQKIGEWSQHLGCMDSDWMLGKDGTPYLIELNPRFGGGYPFTHCAGANIPLACVNWARGVDNDAWYRDFKTGIRTYKEISLFTFRLPHA